MQLQQRPIIQMFPILQKNLEMKREGKELAESLRTPMERLEATMARLRKLKAAGAITEETYQRALEREKGKIGEDKWKGLKGRFGFAEYGKRLQDLFLQREDPLQKRIADNADQQTKLLERIEAGQREKIPFAILY